MKDTVIFEVMVRINDDDGLLEAARAQLIADGWPPSSIDSLLIADGELSQANCVVALLAPGGSPTPSVSFINVTARKMQ